MRSEKMQEGTKSADGLLIHRLWVRFPPLSQAEPTENREETSPTGGRRSWTQRPAASAVPVPRTFSELKRYRFKLWKRLQAFPLGTPENAALRAELTRTGKIAAAVLRGGDA
jgi:hypothetical protein